MLKPPALGQVIWIEKPLPMVIGPPRCPHKKWRLFIVHKEQRGKLSPDNWGGVSPTSSIQAVPDGIPERSQHFPVRILVRSVYPHSFLLKLVEEVDHGCYPKSRVFFQPGDHVGGFVKCGFNLFEFAHDDDILLEDRLNLCKERGLPKYYYPSKILKTLLFYNTYAWGRCGFPRIVLKYPP